MPEVCKATPIDQHIANIRAAADAAGSPNLHRAADSLAAHNRAVIIALGMADATGWRNAMDHIPEGGDGVREAGAVEAVMLMEEALELPDAEGSR